MRYAIYRNSDQMVQKVLTTNDPSIVAANTPGDCSSMPIQDGADTAPGMTRSGTKFVAVVAVETDAQALQRMIDTIDAECESLSMQYLTTGGAKKREYARKAQEVYDYTTLSASQILGLLAPLNLAATRARFPWTMAEVDDTGDTFAVVMARYTAGVTASALTLKLAARSQKLKIAIRAAATTAARTTIFNARSWPTS